MGEDPTGPRRRQLDLELYGQTRSLGVLPTSIHTDARTLVRALARQVSGRGRPIILSSQRVAAVDAALRADGSFHGVEALREAISTWRQQKRLRADAEGINGYYNAARSSGYTQRLEGPQAALATRCFELTGLDAKETPLVLDVGCGSGLSSVPLRCYGAHVIGLDLSFQMLKVARGAGAEVVQADMARVFPFRSAVFDGIVSVSAAQFLCEKAAGEPPAIRAARCMRESWRMLRTPVENAADMLGHVAASGRTAVFQYHPPSAGTASAAQLLQSAAHLAGFTAAILVDPTHHTTAVRWYLHAVVREPKPSCHPLAQLRGTPNDSSLAYENPSSCGTDAVFSGSSPAACHAYHTQCPARVNACCLLSLAEWTRRNGLRPPQPSNSHRGFLEAEHARAAHKLLRKFRKISTSSDGPSHGVESSGHAEQHQNNNRESAQDKLHIPCLSDVEHYSAEVLWRHFGGVITLDELKTQPSLQVAIAALHTAVACEGSAERME